jgi:CubicO group peptidase (beta-lactamase class C family)
MIRGKTRTPRATCFAVLLAVTAVSAVAGLGRDSVAAPLVALPAQPSDVPWPTKQWPVGNLSPAVPRSALEEILSVVAAPRPLLGQTRAVVIIQGGRLVTERYMPGFGPDTRLISWSVAKSITQALVGIGVREGLIAIDKPMGNPRWAPGDPRAAVTWRQWINMVDGQDYHEIAVEAAVQNDAAKMLYGQGRLDVAAYAASLPLIHTPGAYWNYNSAGVNLVADALGRVFASGAAPPERRRLMAEVLSQQLFAPLGMSSAQPEFDATGTFIGSALVYATARDYARFGLLYLRDGVWDGRRLLPEGWVDFARSPTVAKNGESYGAGWWVEPAADPDKPGHNLPSPKSPGDAFRAQGHEGQLIVIVPSKDLVVVRLGLLDGFKGWRALGDWMRSLIALFPTAPTLVSPGEQSGHLFRSRNGLGLDLRRLSPSRRGDIAHEGRVPERLKVRSEVEGRAGP